MLTIRQAQMDALHDELLKQFEQRMVMHLRSTCPEETREIAESELRSTIRAGISSAANYEVMDEVDVRRYLECLVLYGPDFDTNSKTSWAGSILRDNELTGMEKMNQIDDYLLFECRGKRR